MRRYLDKQIELDILKKLVRNAVKAPSGGNIQPWEFVIVNDKHLIQSIANYSPGITSLSPALIIICIDLELAKRGGKIGLEKLALIDISMAAQNIVLSALEYGLGSCVIKSFQPKLVSRILDLPEKVVPELVITLGMPDEIPRSRKERDIDAVTHLNGW